MLWQPGRQQQQKKITIKRFIDRISGLILPPIGLFCLVWFCVRKLKRDGHVFFYEFCGLSSLCHCMGGALWLGPHSSPFLPLIGRVWVPRCLSRNCDWVFKSDISITWYGNAFMRGQSMRSHICGKSQWVNCWSSPDCHFFAVSQISLWQHFLDPLGELIWLSGT